MIFHRLAVSRFKGIGNVDIAFAPKGITLIEGPNEIGKSSLVHALTTLFEEPYTRIRRKFEHLIPKDNSGTPEILLEAESGDYRFIYRKSYIDNKAAELTVIAPHPERFEGAQAQEQFDRILNETLDRSLWKALMLQQGSAVGLPEVEDQQALMTALDKAVASHGGTPDAENLFNKISKEWNTYFHSGHSGELQRLSELRDAVEKAEAEVNDAEKSLEELNGRIALARQLRRSLDDLRKREATEQQMKADFENRLAEVEKREKTLDAERAKLEIARQKRAGAEAGRELRKRFLDAEAGTGEALARHQAELEAATASTDEAGRIAGEKEAAWKRLEQERARLEKLAALRRADHDYLRDRFDLDQMRERKQRIDASTARVGKANSELAANTISEAAVKDIHAAREKLEQARIRRDSAVPKVRLDAIAPCDVVLGGETVRLAAAETRELPVAGALNLGIPGMLSVTVTAGDGGDNLEARMAEAGERLRALLAKYGIENPDDAPRLLEKRREALRIIDDHKRVEKENLRDLVYSGDAGGLVERILGLEEKIAAYERARPDDVAVPSNLDLARAERDAAEQALGETVAACGAAEAAWKAAEAERRRVRDEALRLEAERNVTARELETTRQSLIGLRRDATDEELEKAFADADAAYSDASRAVAVIETELKELDPVMVRGRLATLEKALAKTAGEKADTRNRLTALEVEVDFLGGKGLNERVEEAAADLGHKKKILGAELRRAAAAKLLFEVVSETRERSQKAYILPLKNQIEDLARSVFATDVGVDLTPDLRIAGRTMNGQHVAFAQLSGGAREQFSLIHRAACSLAVSRDGGVPLILDDALGYSDAERLIGMNDVLSRAAQKCQIIILTCMPGRYGYLEPAARIDMEQLQKP